MKPSELFFWLGSEAWAVLADYETEMKRAEERTYILVLDQDVE